MPEVVMPGPVQGADDVREAVCIHTKKVYDSCRDKDCIEDLRFYPMQCAQSAIDRAISIKAGRAELLHSYIDVEPVGFHRGYYTVDVRYFYRVTAEAFVGAARPVEISGLAVFDKRVILFGSEGGAKEFSSEAPMAGPGEQDIRKNHLPTAVVEAVDPIVLGIKLVDVGACGSSDGELSEIPASICACFGGDLSFSNEGKRVYVSLGQFSIIRLERDAKLLIPVYNYCMPEKECTCGGEEDPCDVFRQVRFPMDEFFPPNSLSGTEPGRDSSCCT